jgi:diguanylate cyclase (GGDEF)-like protein/PAS domain S-box-containing protein
VGKQNSFVHLPYRYLDSSGTYRWVRDTTMILRDAEGTATHYIGYLSDITHEYELEEENRTIKGRFELAWEGANDGLWDWDFVNNRVFYSSRWKSMLGYSDEEIGDTPEEFFGRAAAKHEPYEIEYRIIDSGGDVIWVNETGRNVPVGDGREVLEGVINNITPEKNMTEKLRKFIDIQNAIVILTDGTALQFANKMFYDFFGFDDREAFLRQHRCIGERFVERDDFFHLGQLREGKSDWVESLLGLPGRERIVMMLDKASAHNAFTVSINRYDRHAHIVSFTDISDTMMEKLHLKHQVVRDKLTDAYNRGYLDTAAPSLIRSHGEQQKRTGIIYFDVDHFKQINDTYGHSVGDHVLKDLVGVVRRNTRSDDAVIRMGGEEFMVIAPTPSLQILQRTAENLRTAIEAHRFDTVGSLTCSFGIVIKEKKKGLAEAIDSADVKRCEAERGGRNRPAENACGAVSAC